MTIGGRKRTATSIHSCHFCTHRRSIRRYFWFGAAAASVVQFHFMYSILHTAGSSSSSHDDGAGLGSGVHRQSFVSFTSEQRRNLRRRNALHDLGGAHRNEVAAVNQQKEQGQELILQEVSPAEAQRHHDVLMKKTSVEQKRPLIDLQSEKHHVPHHHEHNPPTSGEYYLKHEVATRLHPGGESENQAKKDKVLTGMENYNLFHDPSDQQKTKNHILSALHDQLLEPVVRAGKMYTIGRGDRSGSVVSDMLYAHAFAYAHNVTYLGACFTVKGLPKKDTRHLLQALHLNNILPFACPPGVDTSLNLLKPNATELSPLMLNDDVYRFNLHENFFTPAWRESIQKSVRAENQDTNLKKERPYEIAVHVRRGDVSPCKYIRRYLHNEHYLKLIDQFTPSPEERDNRPVHVTIYSESASFEPFDVFRERGYTVELDTKDLAIVWKALATADLVILSRSYFSFVPAAVNPNTVVATEFFEFDPLPGWKRADEALVKETDREINRMKNDRCSKTEDAALKT